MFASDFSGKTTPHRTQRLCRAARQSDAGRSALQPLDAQLRRPGATPPRQTPCLVAAAGAAAAPSARCPRS